MKVSDPIALLGNAFSFFAVTFKTIYDVFINPFLFREEAKTIDLLEAAKNKRDRADNVTVWTFIFVGIGYMISIAALIKI